MQDKLKELFAALIANCDRYIAGGNYQAFAVRNRELHAELEANGLEDAFLAMWRQENPYPDHPAVGNNLCRP